MAFLKAAGCMHPGRESRPAPHGFAHRIKAGLFEHRADIVQNRSCHTMTLRRRHQHGEQSAQRCPYHHHAIETCLLDQAAEIVKISLGGVAFGVARIFAFSPAAEIHADNPPIPGKMIGQRFEIARIAGQTRNAEQRRTTRWTGIIAVMQAQPVGAGPEPVFIRLRQCRHPSLAQRLALPSDNAHYRQMREEPQAAPYTPDPRIAAIAGWIGEPVESAPFPATVLRFRNRRWDKAIGLDDLDDDRWIGHFGRFEPLPGNLQNPLALRYHGHQFRVYNPEIGDGRGFLFAQMRDARGRLLDCGTKGSGQTPYSRFGDGRLTLKGAVREILATEMLEAQGVNTSKTLSVIETGEALERNDEPSPTRSAVLVRLSHGHIRIGTFQRLASIGQTRELEELVEYCLATYPGPLPPQGSPDAETPAVILLHQAVERLADLAASYMVSGFVHGVLNTDNMNITGESFDYGPWRWLPKWDQFFTAAYFDHEGLYAFGRQAEAISWNCAQLAIALSGLADTKALVAALQRFAPLYQENLSRRFLWRLGLQPRNPQDDMALVVAAEAWMRDQHISPDRFFFEHRAGRNASGPLAQLMARHELCEEDDAYWHTEAPQSMLIEEVEALWAQIDQHDDWSALDAKILAIRQMGSAMGAVPVPAGHIQ